MSYENARRMFDRHILECIVEKGNAAFGATETFYGLAFFMNDWVSKDLARALLRDLTDRGFCHFHRGLFNDDGEPAGSGYGITEKGLEYYQELVAENAAMLMPKQVVAIIANNSATTGILAGVGGSELAGNIISTLSANPDLIGEYLANPAGTLIDRAELFRPEQGALSWLARNGQIVTPQEMRAHLGQADN
ncbi:hypothetical protein [Leisingera sp. ANG-M7]|uniref:hypothetical protein n=1 Tax=Leisingera sp. ANG-M7 TaxID=1577902 RepID=UPI00057EAB78|nr:hypothetical protein [Leisingera sp. ANG-M7]KIC36523.1 hypothetical protein RA26_12355 [Leisingera sp. ANG-M7]